mmetsp:Transcript_26103/g.55534  ORF Transcript_26103/g.55534 Transcript_26103/m.55534 type:complete len:249 (-) Transcript_26103:301-1047(-)
MFLKWSMRAQCTLVLHGHARVTHIMLSGVVLPILLTVHRQLVAARGDLPLHPAQIHHEIELVQIAMYQAVLRQPPRQHRALLEDALGLRGAHPIRVQLIQRHAAHESHGDDVTILSHRLGRGIAHVVQRLHESVLLERRGSGEEQPRVGQGSILRSLFFILGEGVDHEVIALLLHVTEGRPPEPVELEHDLRVPRGDGEVDVALLPRADLVPDPGDDPAGLQVVQCEYVVARVREPISVVAAALVVAQ